MAGKTDYTNCQSTPLQELANYIRDMRISNKIRGELAQKINKVLNK